MTELSKTMPAHREPTLQATPLVCEACGEKWSQKLIVNAPVSVMIAHWRSLQCPECGARWKRLAFRCDEQARRDVAEFAEGLTE